MPQPDEMPSDNQPETQSDIEKNIRAQVQNKDTWLRVFFMAVFLVIFYAVFFVTLGIAVIQFFARLLSGKSLASLDDFNRTLATYAHDIVAYVTFASDAKPFPFKE